MCNVASCSAYIGHVGPVDWVVNATGYTAVDKAEGEPNKAFELNSKVPEELSRMAKQAGARFMHFSTDFVFDGHLRRPYLENDETAPLQVYGRSKLSGEIGVLSVHAEALVLRTSWLFGVHGRCFPETILKRVAAGEPVSVVTDQEGCPTSTALLARSVVNLIQANASGGIYHVSGSEAMTWFQFAERVVGAYLSETGRGKEPIATWLRPTTSQMFRTAARRPPYSVLACSKASAVVPPMVDLDQRIQEFAAHWVHSR